MGRGGGKRGDGIYSVQIEQAAQAKASKEEIGYGKKSRAWEPSL